jgi:hypothetical protein
MAADGAILVGGIDQIEKVRRDRERQTAVREPGAGVFLRRERRHQALELFQRRDAVLELPNPAIPVLVWHIAPKAPTGGMKLLEPR